MSVLAAPRASCAPKLPEELQPLPESDTLESGLLAMLL